MAEGKLAAMGVLKWFLAVSAAIAVVGLVDLTYYASFARDNAMLLYMAIFFVLYGGLSALVVYFKARFDARRVERLAPESWGWAMDFSDFSKLDARAKLDELEKRHKDGKVSEPVYEALKRRIREEEGKRPPGGS